MSDEREDAQANGEPGELEPHEFGSKRGDPDWCHWCGENRSHPAHAAPQDSGAMNVPHADWIRDTAMDLMLASEVEEAILKLTVALKALTAGEPVKDVLPNGHIILEQSETLDGRVSQTVRVDTTGEEYERIVHADEAYGEDK